MSRDNIEKLPKTVTKEMFVTLRVSGYAAGDIQFWDCNVANSGEDFILLTTKKMTVKIPQNIDVKGRVIEGLEAEKDKIQARHHMELKDIQDKIDNLLAIEYKPEAEQ